MATFDYDLFVIGAGSGGVRASRMAASFGAKVAVAEDRYMGGTCVNVGCVPKKLYVYASEYANSFNDAKGFGWEHQGANFNWATLRDNKIEEITRLNGIYHNMLNNAGVDVINGRASLVDPNTVNINGKNITAERILIATGGWPFIPEIEGKEHVLHSNQIFDLEHFPKRILIVGGGYIATEFASIFNGLGAETIQLYRKDKILRGFDEDIRQFTTESIIQAGVDLRVNTDVKSIHKNKDGSFTATLNNGDTIHTDVVFYATGRKPNLQNLGIEQVGIQLNANGTIKVNEKFQTNINSIFALGDVIGGMELTPVALEEGMAFAKHFYNKETFAIDYNNIATAVFCQPNIGTCGMTEAQAQQQYHNIDVYESNFRAMKHTIGGRQERTYMKMIVDADSDKVLGVHMVGEDAGEIIQGLAVAMNAGATKTHFDHTVGIHPTAAEEFVTMRTKRK